MCRTPFPAARRSGGACLAAQSVAAVAEALTPRLRWLPADVLVLGLALTGLLCAWLVKTSTREAKSELDRQASAFAAALTSRVQSYVDTLPGLRVFGVLQKSPSDAEFLQYVQAISLQKRFPGLALTFMADLVPNARRSEYVQSVAADRSTSAAGHPGFMIKPPGERPEYMVLRHSYPMDTSFGYDLYDPGQNYRAVVEAAVAGGQYVATEPLLLSRDRFAQSKPLLTSVVIRAAVYADGVIPPTPEARAQAAQGVVGIAFSTNDLVRSVLPEKLAHGAHVVITDTQARGSGANAFVFDSAWTDPTSKPEALRSEPWSTRVQVADRMWDIEVRSFGPAWAIDQNTWWLLALGLALSAALTAMTRILVQSNVVADSRIRIATRALAAEKENLQALLDNISSGVIVHGADTHVIDANPAACLITGLSSDQLLGKVAIDPFWCFLEEDGSVMPLERYPVQQVLSSGSAVKKMIMGMRRPDLPEPTWGQVDAYPLRDEQGRMERVVVTFADISERVRGERLLASEARALKAMSLGAPLEAVLEEILVGLESIFSSTMASVSQVSSDGQHLLECIAPRLPTEFKEALAHLPVGPSAATPGAAACRRALVVARDIDTDPSWADYRALAQQHGLRACWAWPVQDPAGKVVAILAVYHAQLREPPLECLAIAQGAINQIELAIDQDRKDAALRASEQRFRNCFQGASAGMVIAALDGRVLEVNAAYCRMLGYSAEELYTRTVRDLIHPMDWPRRKAHMKALEQGDVDSVVEEDRYLTKTRETVWIRVSISRIQSVTGRVEGFVVIAEDINEQRKTLQALKETQASLNMASRIGRMGAWWVNLDASEVLVHMSDVACEIYGIAAGTVLTRDQAVKPYLGEHAEQINTLFERCATVGEPFDEELSLVNTAGHTVWVRSMGEAVRGEDGVIERVNGSIQDISTRKQAQIDIEQLNAELENRVQVRTAQLEAVNRELETFSYSVSHDLRAPLNTVNGFGQLLHKTNEKNLDDKGRHYLYRIRAGAQQMGQLIEGILSLATMARDPLRPQPVDLSELARRLAQECREREPEREVALHIQDGLHAIGDPTLLAVVMQNLLGNGWKYTGKQARPEIEVGQQVNQNGDIVYFVRDNGAGFDMAQADKLFGAFQRLHSQSEFTGTGVGLANVKRVVERHGGRVWAESRIDEGATFYFTLAESPKATV